MVSHRVHRHFLATLQRHKLYPREELDWSLPTEKLDELAEVLEELAFRLPKLRELEEDQPGDGVRVAREHFKWFCQYLYWSHQLKSEVAAWRQRRDEEDEVHHGFRTV